jgi:P pilus assembly protein, pilin FimA
MLSSRIKLAATLALGITLAPAYASNVLYFTGSIVEDPCNITPASHNISVTCPQNKKQQTQQISYSDAVYGRVAIPDRATLSMKYLNPEKTLAIVQVDYR